MSPVVYSLVSSTGVAYIGRTVDLDRRLSEHRRAGRRWESVKVRECFDLDGADWLERMMIATWQPGWNVLRPEPRPLSELRI